MGSFSSPSPVPGLCPVAEATRLHRIGRTEGYAPIETWRDSGGESGVLLAGTQLEEAVGAPVLMLPTKESAHIEQEAQGTPELRSIDGDLADTASTENAADDGQAVLPFSA